MENNVSKWLFKVSKENLCLEKLFCSFEFTAPPPSSLPRPKLSLLHFFSHIGLKNFRISNANICVYDYSKYKYQIFHLFYFQTAVLAHAQFIYKKIIFFFPLDEWILTFFEARRISNSWNSFQQVHLSPFYRRFRIFWRPVDTHLGVPSFLFLATLLPRVGHSGFTFLQRLVHKAKNLLLWYLNPRILVEVQNILFWNVFKMMWTTSLTFWDYSLDYHLCFFNGLCFFEIITFYFGFATFYYGVACELFYGV